MDDQSIAEVVNEASPLLTGCAPGKIFQLGQLSLAIDFRVREGYLFISADPQLPRLYLIKRRVRELEKQGSPLNQFSLSLRKELGGTTLAAMQKDGSDRVVWLRFNGTDEVGAEKIRTLIVQLTGRSANLFLLVGAGEITQSARATKLPGQQIGETYKTPESAQTRESKSDLLTLIRSKKFGSTSEAADSYFTNLIAERAFNARVATARAELRRKLSQQEKLRKQLEQDLQSHADAEENKRLGELLLANLSTAKRIGKRLTLIDFFAEGTPAFELELDEQITLPEEASRRFELYSRSKRAIGQIAARIESVRKEIDDLRSRLESLDAAVAGKDEHTVADLIGPTATAEIATKGKSTTQKIPGTRRYISTDGFEILVGRTARDNDHLTFKVAKPNDLWLHAADYGGSHVVVRNSTRKDLPPKTLIEAAQLAAYFSQARKDPKVDVHYTQRKFVSKPKGTAPGLVRMTRFKNITVEPQEAGARS